MKSKRGIIMLKNIPPGFYENQMFKFFSQFGKVNRLKLARSRKTTGSKGYAFIEFAFEEVAKIVADTMNNYFMFDHILKASFFSPENIHHDLFKNWNKVKVSSTRLHKAKSNLDKSEKEWSLLKDKKLKSILSVQNKLKSFDLNFKCIVIDESDNLNNQTKEKNGTGSSEEDENDFLYIDPKDEGIYFKTPPNTKKVIKKLSSSKKCTPLTKSKLSTSHLLTSHKKKILSLPKFVLLRQTVPNFRI